MRPLGRVTISTAATVAALALGGAGAADATGAAHHHVQRNLRALRRQLALQAYARPPQRLTHTTSRTPGDNSLAEQQDQWDFERSAPASAVSGQALISAGQAAGRLPAAGGAWQDVTTRPYDGQPSNYTDPFWSNVGAGFSIVGGRTTALTQTPDGTWFAGTADGGVWRSANQGQTWTPTFDTMPSLSIGALAVDPKDGSLWVGTGEANQSQDSYTGTGVYRSTDDGATFQRVGDDTNGNNPLVSHTIFQLAFAPDGVAYVATDNGLFRYAPGTGQWTEVLDPAGATDNPPYDQQTTTVAVVPNTGGQDVITAIGWHGPGNTQYNGFYRSTNGGQTFTQVTPTGDINASDIGRTTFAYSADGSKLYAIVQSVAAEAAGKESVLQGIFSVSGSAAAPAGVAGPWTKIADETKLAGSGSALPVGSGYGVGIQAWYNQDLAVDPTNPDHVYAGLEEVFESTDGGNNWVTASPYWNYTLACENTSAGCPNTTHPDQHAMMISDQKIVIGNDGGVYSRPLADTQQYGDWSDLNATLASWQYYDARAGSLPGQGVGVWGGLQDNGTSVLTSGSSQMAEPAGGDGFDVIVDPQDANRMVGEYTDGTLYKSTDGGHTFNHTNIAPSCISQETYGMTPLANCDAGMRFVTPLVPDQQDTNTWVTGGQYVWVSHAGWNTTCTTVANCTWQQAYDTGAKHAVTALSSAHNGNIIYAAWVAGGGNPGPSFASGIATNYGGHWHQVSTAGLPNRYIAGVAVDPANPAHAYAVFNGYSRRFIPGGGVGHVFETWNGGRSWQDISGNLPDIASDALVLSGGQLALATDLGMYTAPAGQGANTRWSRLGTGLPDAAVDDVTPGPGGYIYAATHGRGIWRLQMGRGAQARR